MSRLPPTPGERIDRDRTIRFTFDGATRTGLAGDTIASALYADGQRTFSRSFKYHRRRGLLCCAGQCPNCLVAVDGAPGVRACTEPLREGMRVEHMNATPSLEHDVMAVSDRLSALTPPGFYYKTFIRPRRLWPVFERVLRNAAGLGRLPGSQSERRWRTDYRRRHADVLVIGGGLAGLSAAIAAAELGADVVLADDGPEPGGRLLWEQGESRARELLERASEVGVELLSAAPALGFYDGLVAVWQSDTLHQVRAAQQVLATGAIEQPLVFAGNDLPGVMLSGGALRLMAYGVQPGEEAVVATVGERGIAAARALSGRGVRVRAIVDMREGATLSASDKEALAGTEMLAGWQVLEARGRGHVSGVVVSPLSGGAERELACDLLVVCGGEAPSAGLLGQAGGTLRYDQDAGHFAVADLPDGVHVAGQLAGHAKADRSGALAGIAAAHALGLGDESSKEREQTLAAELAGAAPGRCAVPQASAGEGRGKCFACLCEDVTVKDIEAGVREGFDSIELSKRYTTTTMGPCQGRMCQLTAVRATAQATGLSLADVGTTTPRPPVSTVPMGALAGRPFEPAKRTPLHDRHEQAGGRIDWAGDWRRVYDYGDPQGEAEAVHESVGLIDVSPLGKLLVRGPQAGELLDRIYPNRLSNLAPGRIRYGLLTSEAGRIMDDGTICRVDAETFYVTTTSRGAGAVEQWISWWLADWRMEVALTDVTQGLAAVNLAGPRAREVLSSICEQDCSPEAFPYLAAREGRVAGVACLMLRVGFVGELGYELHFPAAHAETLWDALLAAGERYGIRPFGLEPQRLLRLQKQHLIVGQDTDSESTPYGAGMGWAVKLEKEDFVGRAALALAATEQPPSQLVGLELEGARVPAEGAVILDEADRPAGQLTSARYSRQLRQVIGMGWVPAGSAVEGARVVISDGPQQTVAHVRTRPFYDPDGERQRL